MALYKHCIVPKKSITQCIDCPAPIEQKPGRGTPRLRCDSCIREYKNASRRAGRRGIAYRRCLKCGTRMAPLAGFTYCTDCRPRKAESAEYVCLGCGERFATGSDAQRYCTPSCQAAASDGARRERNKRKWSESEQKWVTTYQLAAEREGLDAYRERMRERYRFTPTTPGLGYVRPSGAAYTRLRTQVLAEESDCWICGRPIDPDLTHPHNMSGSLDHVVPMTEGGPMLDRDNCRAAHYSCNSGRRGGPTT